MIPVEIPTAELPIYELDAEEQLVYEAADAALSDAAAPSSAAPEPEPEPDRFFPSRSRSRTAAGSRRALRDARSPDARILRARVQRIQKPTILQHCIFASALACAVDADGNDDLGLKAHLAAQSQILHRVSLHEKLGKKEPIGEYAGKLLAGIDAIAPRPVRPVALPGADRIALCNELHEPALVVVRKIAEERDRWDFVKARQLTLALQAQRALVDDDARAAAIDNALRSYAQHSMTVLQKLFVRLRIDRTTGVLFQTDVALDAAARVLLAALAAALAN